MIRAIVPGDDPRACHLFGGVLGGIFGGGGSASSSTSVTTSTTTNVDVQVNPNIGVAVDLEPVAELAAAVADGNAATREALAAQGAAFRDGFSGVVDQIGRSGGALVVLALVAFGMVFVARGRA